MLKKPIIFIALTTVILFIMTIAVGSTLSQTNNDPLVDEDPFITAFFNQPDETESLPNIDIVTWDKETQTEIPHPSVSGGSMDEADEYSMAKTAQLDQTQLVYPSGFKQAATGNLDSTLLNELADSAARGSSDPIYGIIQFKLPFDTEARLELEKEGVVFYDYIEGGGLYARIPPASITHLQTLHNDGRVLYAGSIPVQARIQPDLLELANTVSEENIVVTLALFDVPTEAQMSQIKQYLTITGESLHPAYPILDGVLQSQSIVALASLPFVRWLEIQYPATTNNLESTMALGTDVLHDASSLADGRGIKVGVFDTGIGSHNGLPSSRIIDQYDYVKNDATANDTDGHGTHVAGTIGNNSSATNSSWLGHATGSSLLIYKLIGTGRVNPFNTDLQNALIRSDSKDMVIANHSWGTDGTNNQYDIRSTMLDKAVRGEYGNQYMLMVVASGNDNKITHAPGTAKNVVTVGAVRDGNSEYMNYSSNSCGTVSDANWRPSNRACFSNYGPVNTDGDSNTRVKPDLVAPGVHIYSTAPGNGGAYMNGTSMAAPGVTGALTAFLSHKGGASFWVDWPEKTKALALARAINIGDSKYVGRGYANVYDMAYYSTGITAPGTTWGGHIASTDSYKTHTFTVPPGYHEVKVVLTWPDPAGATEVINDLDVRVYANSSCSGTPIGTSFTTDDVVEYVTISSGKSTGTWCAKVSGYSIAVANQSYGLANFIIMKPATVTTEASVSNSTPVNTFWYYTTAKNSGLTAGGNFIRITVPTGLTVEGAWVYTDDGRKVYYSTDQSQKHVMRNVGDGTWRLALGALNNHGPRLVRWDMRVSTEGSYTLKAETYYRKGDGNWESSDSVYTTVATPIPESWQIYLPYVKR